MKIPDAVEVILERRDWYRRDATNAPRGSEDQLVAGAVADVLTGLALDLLERDFTALREQVTQ